MYVDRGSVYSHTFSLDVKRSLGCYYTCGNPFLLRPFRRWAQRAQLEQARLVEPFAGAAHLLDALKEVGLVPQKVAAYDIYPQDPCVLRRDTLKDFPKGYTVCITNPPWLYKSAARRRGLPFPNTKYEDLYQYALECCLQHVPYVAAIVPASYLASGLFFERLWGFVFLSDRHMFSDTENPVGLALFVKKKVKEIKLYRDNKSIGEYYTLQRRYMPQPRNKTLLRFNDPKGALGLVGIDNTCGSSIRFCKGEALSSYKIQYSSRSITRISAPELSVSKKFLETLNAQLEIFREKTQDVFLTPFKGLRKDGKYRRRMDYRLARKFINQYITFH